jgi:pimeloyl-ACP methyl ester carboxylesterase
VSVLACEGVSLCVEQAGSGQALVLVHGAWSARNTWDPVFQKLATRFHVIRYDRRGYGESQRPGVGPSEHVMDLLALIRTLRLERVILVGNSLGALIAIRMALRASELVSIVVAHEPPMLGLLEHGSPLEGRVYEALARALNAASSGNHRLAAQLYVEGMASAPGTWEYLPEDMKQGFVENAPGFLDDASALDESELPARELARLGQRLVVTRGDRTSSYLKFIVERLYSALPELRRHVFVAGGHVPHQSCPEDFVAKIVELAKIEGSP